jgi:hypothetical protein
LEQAGLRYLGPAEGKTGQAKVLFSDFDDQLARTWLFLMVFADLCK